MRGLDVLGCKEIATRGWNLGYEFPGKTCSRWMRCEDDGWRCSPHVVMVSDSGWWDGRYQVFMMIIMVIGREEVVVGSESLSRHRRWAGNKLNVQIWSSRNNINVSIVVTELCDHWTLSTSPVINRNRIRTVQATVHCIVCIVRQERKKWQK